MQLSTSVLLILDSTNAYIYTTNKLRNRTTMMWKTAKFAQREFKNELGKVSMLSLQVCESASLQVCRFASLQVCSLQVCSLQVCKSAVCKSAVCMCRTPQDTRCATHADCRLADLQTSRLADLQTCRLNIPTFPISFLN